MRHLLATTSLTPILLFAALPAAAQTSISTATTAPVSTSTTGDLTITSAGSIKPTSGTVVTLNSDNDIKNEGTIQVTDANGSIGIDVVAGGTGTITNAVGGKIVLDENYTPTDTDTDGDVDGPFANGTGRFGIRTSAAFTGSIVNAGQIGVEGKDSGGIRLGGLLTGSLTNSGSITVIGDRSIGIRAEVVTGNVRIEGTIAAQGQDAIGVALDGDISGTAVFQGSVSATGYRYTTAPADVTKLDADDLLQGGPAVRVAGNVGGGILLDAPPADNSTTDDDEDDDGVKDANETTAALVSYGAAPALEIASATKDLTIGAVAGDTGGHGLVIKGGVGSSGVYANIDSVALQIGGKGFGVDLSGGINIASTGLVSAVSLANATGMRLSTGVEAPDVTVNGTVVAQGGKAATHVARAISIEAGATVDKLTIGGVVRAGTTEAGTAVAVYDGTGNLDLIEVSGAVGAIGATGTGAEDRMIAFDLRQNSGGATVKLLAAATGKAAPQVVGNVLFGSGNDVFNVADGTVNGNAVFGAGDNSYLLSGDAIHTGKVQFGTGVDTLALTGTSQLNGAVDFGGGADIFSLGSGTRFTGSLANAGTVGLTVNGTLDISTIGAVAVGSLDVGTTGVIGVSVNGNTGVSTRYDVAGAASFAAGSKVLVRLNNVAGSVGSFVIVDAGALTGGNNLSTTGAVLPFLFKSSISSDAAAGTVTLNIARKTTTELGLNRSESAAYDAIFNVVDNDSMISASFLALTDQAGVRASIGNYLPDHAGGIFAAATQAARSGARFLQDNLPTAGDSSWNVWLQQVAWGTSKDLGDTAAYDVSGWGMNGGAERELGGFGRLGGSLSFYLGRDSNGTNDNEVMVGEYEAALHWRGNWGGLNALARVSGAKVDLDSTRRFDGTVNGGAFSRVAEAKWGGFMWSATGAVSYDLKVSKRLHIRPLVSVDYYRLNEDGYTETGGGDAFNLTVDDRTSDELAGNATLTVGYELGNVDFTRGWFRVEAEGGRRQILGGELGTTTARFGTDDPFTLLPEDRQDGWLGRLRLMGGQETFAVTGEVSAEEQQGQAEVAFRLGIQMGW